MNHFFRYLVLSACFLSGCSSIQALNSADGKTDRQTRETETVVNDSAAVPGTFAGSSGNMKEITNNSTAKANNTAGTGDTSSDLLSPQQTVQQASIWVAQADTLLVQGDAVNAEETLILAVSAVSSVLFELEPIDRRVWMDSLAVWAKRYIESFARPGQIVGPGEEGLSTVDAEMIEESLIELPEPLVAELPTDSLVGILAPDSIMVELDTTVTDLVRLPGIPDTTNRLVEMQIEYFTTTERGRKAMTVWLDRAEEMIPRIVPILRKHRLPEDLVYLSMIKSGFRTDARSYAKAVGPWQFIYSTGKIFDLKADWWYDERRDPEMATHAAAKYLRQLYEHTGDWYLAMAGYNCGEGRVNREIRRSKTRDFWKMRRFPRQTRGYVPTFLAARKIASDPESYGFKIPILKTPDPRDSVIVTECVDLSALAKALGMEGDVLKEMNPAIFRWCTPPTIDTTVVYIPKGMAENFEEKFVSIPDEEKTSWVRHKVRSGQTLSYIADKYRTSMRAVMDVPANRLRNPHKIREGQWLLIPVAPSGSGYDYAHIRDMSEPDVPSGKEKRIHVVRRGQTLSEIAEMYHVGLSKLMTWNRKTRRSIIRVGERLTVYQPKGKTSPVVASAAPGSEGISTSGKYTVRRGDSPWNIAKKHRVTTSQLLAANNLSVNAKIHPGDVLVIPGAGNQSESEASYHVVRRGDTLWEIAERYRVSVNDLKQWNKIRDSRRLNIGDRLVVYRTGGSG